MVQLIYAMTKFLLLCSMLLLLATGCKKEDDCLGSDLDIVKYLAEKNITATEGESGLFYVIDEPGEAEKPTLQSTVTVNYKGTTTNGDTFDETTTSPATFPLANLIRGWQQGIPLIGKGGKIRLYIPSSQAYGQNTAGDLCANTDLIFDIELVDFQ